jgi:predicted nucleic acid-binding Zn ribbon protein
MKGIKTSLIIEAAGLWLTTQWGQAALDEARVISLQDGLLTIACLSPALANEIKFREKALIDVLNEKFGPETVSRLKFML